MKRKIKIDVIQLGVSRHVKPWKFIKHLKKGKSKIFEINNIEYNVPLGKSGENWTYTDLILKDLISKIQSDADLIIGFIDYRIQENSFIRQVDENAGVASFYQTDQIFLRNNISLNNFVLLVLYTACVAYYLKHSGNNVDILYHDETRGCLFDMAGMKPDIILSAANMKLCSECEKNLNKYLSDEYKYIISDLKKELKKIRKSLFYQVTDWVKEHIIISLIITSVFTILINLISNYIFYLIQISYINT